MYYPNYLEFYQQSLFPIGPNDQNTLLKNNETIDSDSSHWLIALDGQPEMTLKEFYAWKVVVFKVNEDGYCLLKQPYFVSSMYDSFHEAYEAAKKIEELGRNDKLISSNRQYQLN